MNKTLLRFYKYYGVYGAAPLRRMRRCAPERRSLFIAKFDGLGDFFLLLPLLERLRAGGYTVTLAGSRFQKEVLSHCGFDFPVLPFDTGSYRSLRASLAGAGSVRPEYAVNLSMNVWGGILVNATRAPNLIGLLQEREWYIYKGTKTLYDRTVAYEPSLHSFEVIRRLFSDLLGIGGLAPRLDRPVTTGDEIAVHPYGNWAMRRWPRFGELIGSLLEKGYRCAVLGTAREHAQSGFIGGVEADPRCRIVTLGSIPDLLTELERCRAFIGNDSGPAHYAALIGKQTFVLWGPGVFERIRPLGANVHYFKKEIDCRPCRQRGETCARGTNECLLRIGAREVLDAVTSLVPR